MFKRKSKYKEGKAWYVDYRDPTGKRIIKAIGSSKREAEAYLGKVKASIREGRFFDIKKENRTTFKELLDAYVEFRLKTEKGEKYFNTSIKYFTGDHDKHEGVLRKYFGERLLSEIDLKALEEFRDERKNPYSILNAELQEPIGP